MRLRVRRDPYKGVTVSWLGCDHPWKRSRMMYRSARRKGWGRLIAVAVALDVVMGSRRAQRFLWRRGWSPAKVASRG